MKKPLRQRQKGSKFNSETLSSAGAFPYAGNTGTCCLRHGLTDLEYHNTDFLTLSRLFLKI